jgi:hypothetical protein
MDNQRKDYRHYLLPAVNLPVAVRCEDRLRLSFGVAVNLSVGGIAVRFTNESPPLRESQRCSVRLFIPGEKVELNMAAEVVHIEVLEHEPVFGLRFLPTMDQAESDFREQVIWRFLLEDQRRQRRQLLEATSAPNHDEPGA